MKRLRQYESLQVVERNEPRWPHRKGDLLKRLGRPEEAVLSYEKAIDLYAQLGFVARAAAMAKVVLEIAPERVDVLERVMPDAARKLHRSARSAGVRADFDFGAGERGHADQTALARRAATRRRRVRNG